MDWPQEPDAAKGPKREELLRVVRPLGGAYLRQGGEWQVATKPRPGDVDDWAQCFHDAAMSDLSAAHGGPSLAREVEV